MFDSRLGQTGEGHFTPLTGFHRGQDKSLLLDVARFKYPSHWVDLRAIYEAMKHVDDQSQLTRGFILVSRSTEMFSDLCRISQDFELMAEFTRFFEQASQKQLLSEAMAASGDMQRTKFLDYLMQLPPRFHDLITLFVIQLAFSLNIKKNHTGANLLEEMGSVAAKYPAFLAMDYSKVDTNVYPLVLLFKDYLPAQYKQALCLLMAIFDEELHKRKAVRSTASIQNCSSYIFM